MPGTGSGKLAFRMLQENAPGNFPSTKSGAAHEIFICSKKYGLGADNGFVFGPHGVVTCLPAGVSTESERQWPLPRGPEQCALPAYRRIATGADRQSHHQ